MSEYKGTAVRARRGFSLVELLVVIGIMGVLAAVSIPVYRTFFGAGQTEANATELTSVQAAMDTMMAANQVADVAGQAVPASDFSAEPTGAGTEPLSPTYLRTNPTRCTYTWDTTGKMSQGTCP
ncbi:MAG: type II secretion system protein [Chloroflexi bacterium]|nr:type II secretion system protein [Chloroflexota bacterium]